MEIYGAPLEPSSQELLKLLEESLGLDEETMTFLKQLSEDPEKVCALGLKEMYVILSNQPPKGIQNTFKQSILRDLKELKVASSVPAELVEITCEIYKIVPRE